MTQTNIELAHLDSSMLVDELAAIRNYIDGLTATLREEHGDDDQAALRAEQVSGAIQRLEWALCRKRSKRASSGSR